MVRLHSGWAALTLVFVSLCEAADGATQQQAFDAGSGRSSFADPRTALVRALVAGELEASVAPERLFDVALDDDAAVKLEVARLEALLELETKAPASVSPLWQARDELDRARLGFLELPRERRTELLEAQAAKRAALQVRESESERRVREAAEAHERALAASRAARNETERLLAEESANLDNAEKGLLATEERLASQRELLSARRDVARSWQRRIKEALSGGPVEVDSTYDSLRAALGRARSEFDEALRTIDARATAVPELETSALEGVTSDASSEALRTRRASVEARLHKADEEARALREEGVSRLLEEVTALNRERLDLLTELSADKRAAITGLSEAGFDQARAEVRQLLLILRFHRHVTARWLSEARRDFTIEGRTVWRLLRVLVPWVLWGLAFVWVRRRSGAALALAAERVGQQDRAEGRAVASPLRRVLALLYALHRPLQWLVLLGGLAWWLPMGARELLEVQLLTVIVEWSLGSTIVVNAINSLAAASITSDDLHGVDLPKLRLRSLKLVGRVVVGFILGLVVTARLVGEGTLYSWAWSTLWLATIPLFLVLVRWWRPTVFARLDRARRKTRLQAWALANRSGWKSFLAAMVGAVHLFALGSYKTVRSWLSGFELARRAHAYLFKRELDRLAEELPTSKGRPLNASAAASLAPDRPEREWIPSPSDDAVGALRARVAEGRGGVIALIGNRGQGKSAALRRLTSLEPKALAMACPGTDAVGAVRAALGEAELPSLVLLDDAHLVVKTILGGLAAFDDLLGLARGMSHKTVWVLCLDRVIWPFLRRARDSRPLFDEVLMLQPWSDEQIGQLLTHRTSEAGLSPVFDDLLEALPVGADEADRLEATAARRTGYFRMVWDYSRGNPGVALEAWRASLCDDPTVGVARVRPLQSPDTALLDALPDSSLFVLRAVLQMSAAVPSDIAKATGLTLEQVHHAIRFGRARGFLSEEDDRVRVTWAWLRAVVVLLERRHLLVNE